MIYLSLIWLDSAHRETRELLGNPYRIHQKILNAWEDGAAERVLFRAEGEPREPRVLVQSPHPADWDRAFPDRGVLPRPPVQKFVELRLREGQSLRFQLRANPTVRIPFRDPVTQAIDWSKPGKRVGLLKEVEQITWLHRQGEVRREPTKPLSGGFRVDQVEVRNRQETFSRRRRGGPLMTHHCVEFEGTLVVTDVEALLASVRQGIGAGKGLGFGLLSLAPG